MKRIRILHTADIHLDASFAEIGADAQIGSRLRAAQQHVFSRIMERAYAAGGILAHNLWVLALLLQQTTQAKAA